LRLSSTFHRLSYLGLISGHFKGAASLNSISRTGLKVSFHSLRHSHASALIAAGIDVVGVSRRLGHSSPSITLDIYSHLFQETDNRRGGDY
jgi:integrase